MSFGFGISDLLAVLKLAKTTRRAFIDTPVQFRSISAEIKVLSHILQDLEDLLLERTIPLALSQSLKEHLAACATLLKGIQSTLEKYSSVDTTFNTRRMWHALKWEPDDIKDLRLRLSSNIALLHGINDLLSRHSISQIQRGINKLSSFHDDEESLNIFSWLSAMETAAQHSDIIAKRQSETGQWFLHAELYVDWLQSLRGTLFCPGIPGGGKTIIAASVIEDLWNKFDTDPQIGIAFIYCSYKRQHEQTLQNCLASLLKQLVQKLDKIPLNIQVLYQRYKNRMTKPNLDELKNLLKCVIISYTKVYIVIDALDEYSKIPGTLVQFVQEIHQLQSSYNVNFFATSRPNISEIQYFEGNPKIEIAAKEEDVRKVLENEMSGMPICISKNSDLQTLVKNEIIKAVDGMFLLARLHLNFLRYKIRRKDVIRAVKSLPRGEEALDAAYAETIERIDGQQPDCKNLAKQVLIWISHARRPLTTIELQHALAIELQDSKIDQENLPEVEDMVSFCEGLVTIDEESSVIRLVHYTAQEYLDRISQTWMPYSHKDIALVCLTYLSFDEFSTTGTCENDHEFEDRLQRNVFLDYCARNWGHHVRDANNKTVDEVALGFLDDHIKIASVVQVDMVSAYHFAGYSRNVPLRIEAVHLAAQFGLCTIMTRLLTNGHYSDPKDDFGRTPLSYSAEYGHQSIVKLLLSRHDTDSNSRDQQGRTPLSWAASSNHGNIVETLLRCPSVDVNSKDCVLLSPFSWAARKGCLEVVRYLMTQEDIEKDSRDKSGQTPLSWAAFNGHLEIVKLLTTSPQVDIDSKDHFNQTPLSYAARNGHVHVVSFLVDIFGIDADSSDDEDRTALMWACMHGHLKVVRLLASRPDVQCNTKDQRGQSPLSWAAREGHLDVVRFLMDRKDIQLQSKDQRGLTPLRWAAWNGYEDIVKVLAAQLQKSQL